MDIGSDGEILPDSIQNLKSAVKTTVPDKRSNPVAGRIRNQRRDLMLYAVGATNRLLNFFSSGLRLFSAARHRLCEFGRKSLESTIDNNCCQCYPLLMLDIQVIDDPAAATVALEPTRSRLLSELAVPASAATLATRVGLARQKVNYHLHALEAHGLVRLAQERKWGGLTERLLVATAASYVVSPSALGPVAVDPNREADRLSASYLIALGARVVREVGDLVRRAKEAGKRLATLAVDTEVRFRSATDRAAFSNELTEAITKLVSKYHDESAPGGRAHRLVVVAHPLPQKSDPKEPS